MGAEAGASQPGAEEDLVGWVQLDPRAERVVWERHEQEQAQTRPAGAASSPARSRFEEG